ncbi:MAG: NAD-dependent epimerase [Bacteroidales bacterium]|nr:NAD-dependent epimerase [Bacteroidales bacterium]
MKILVTGAAGFIGANLMGRLAARGDVVIGLDNINDYYDVRLKYGRLAVNGFEGPFEERERAFSKKWPACSFIRADICDKPFLDGLFRDERFDVVVNLAAQAGVRYSISNPYSYLKSNMEGFLNILEACRHNDVRHLVFASSSSVYGLNDKVPFCEEDKADCPVSLYGATKKSNELMAHSYSQLYGIPATGLRFFTVYGPWGRPDMSPMLFASAISKGEPIKVFNGGDMIRDFTYVDDIVEGTMRVIDSVPVVRQARQPVEGQVPFRIYNIGCSNPVRLMDFISEIEDALGIEAKKEFLPMQQGDVYQTYASCANLEKDLGYHPSTTLHEGIGRFIEWFKSGENPLK